MTTDMINGSFEALAGLFILNHCRILYIDKEVRGVSIISSAFFTTWGFWNLYFYPNLGQFWSFCGGIVVVLTNALYVLMLIYYARYYSGPTAADQEMYMAIDVLDGRR